MRNCALFLSLFGFGAGCQGTQAPQVEAPQASPRIVEVAAAEVGVEQAESPAPPVAVLGSPQPVAGAGWQPTVAPRCPATTDDLPLAKPDRDDRRLSRDHLVVVSKTDRRLWLFESGQSAGCWRVGLGFDPQGDKQREGDGRTPEGWYRTSDKPWSTFDGAIAIHYPNRDDARRARARGDIRKPTLRKIEAALDHDGVPPQRTTMGGAVLIHGGGSSTDWTLGCVALDDEDLAELRDRLPRSKRVDLLVLP